MQCGIDMPNERMKKAFGSMSPIVVVGQEKKSDCLSKQKHVKNKKKRKPSRTRTSSMKRGINCQPESKMQSTDGDLEMQSTDVDLEIVKGKQSCSSRLEETSSEDFIPIETFVPNGRGNRKRSQRRCNRSVVDANNSVVSNSTAAKSSVLPTIVIDDDDDDDDNKHDSGSSDSDSSSVCISDSDSDSPNDSVQIVQEIGSGNHSIQFIQLTTDSANDNIQIVQENIDSKGLINVDKGPCNKILNSTESTPFMVGARKRKRWDSVEIYEANNSSKEKDSERVKNTSLMTSDCISPGISTVSETSDSVNNSIEVIQLATGTASNTIKIVKENSDSNNSNVDKGSCNKVSDSTRSGLSMVGARKRKRSRSIEICLEANNSDNKPFLKRVKNVSVANDTISAITPRLEGEKDHSDGHDDDVLVVEVANASSRDSVTVLDGPMSSKGVSTGISWDRRQRKERKFREKNKNSSHRHNQNPLPTAIRTVPKADGPCAGPFHPLVVEDTVGRPYVASAHYKSPLSSLANKDSVADASLINVNGNNMYNPNNVEKTGLRPVIIDGSNVAYGHGGDTFSTRGLEICINYFVKRGHGMVVAFVPCFRRGLVSESDREILDRLERKRQVVLTPSRNLHGRRIASYDDRFIVQCAAEVGGVIVSRDNYRDLVGENEAWRETIERRLLMFTWVGDILMFPDDPNGRGGPRLEEFLRFPQ